MKHLLVALLISGSIVALHTPPSAQDGIKFSEALQIVTDNHAYLKKHTHNPLSRLDQLIPALSEHENHVHYLLLTSVALVANLSSALEKLVPMLNESQKNLLGLKLIERHENRQWQILRYRLYSAAASVLGWCSLGAGIGTFYKTSDPVHAGLYISLGLGFFIGEKLYGRQQARVRALPPATKQEIYNQEFVPNRPLPRPDGRREYLNRVEAGMQTIQLAHDNPFKETLAKMKFTNIMIVGSTVAFPQQAEIEKHHVESLDKILEAACAIRNIDAVLEVTDLLKDAQGLRKNH